MYLVMVVKGRYTERPYVLAAFAHRFDAEDFIEEHDGDVVLRRERALHDPRFRSAVEAWASGADLIGRQEDAALLEQERQDELTVLRNLSSNAARPRSSLRLVTTEDR